MLGGGVEGVAPANPCQKVMVCRSRICSQPHDAAGAAMLKHWWHQSNMKHLLLVSDALPHHCFEVSKPSKMSSSYEIRINRHSPPALLVLFCCRLFTPSRHQHGPASPQHHHHPPSIRLQQDHSCASCGRYPSDQQPPHHRPQEQQHYEHAQHHQPHRGTTP